MGEKITTGLYIEDALLSDINASLEAANCKSRNEFIIEAIRRYITVLRSHDYSELLTPAFESVIGAKIKDTENRIASVLFKQSVELTMMMHIVAGTNDITIDDLAELRKLCVDEVTRLCGRFTFEDAVRFQKRS